MTARVALAAILLSAAVGPAHADETLESTALRVQVNVQHQHVSELLSVKDHGNWLPALDGSASLHIRDASATQSCAATAAERIPSGLLLTGSCQDTATFEQRILLGPEPDMLHVATRLHLNPNRTLYSAEDRYSFLPSRHTVTDAHTGPLDFIWSQNIKKEADDLVPTNGFKSPVVMLQQGPVFAALLPDLNDRHLETRALDLDVTSGPHPWLSFGAIPTEPHDHSFFRRSPRTALVPIADTIHYEYSLVLSAQPPRQGYRRAVRLLWQNTGHPQLLASAREQQNALRPELDSFDSWRQEAWDTDTKRDYTGFPCGDKRCGTLASNRNPNGDWKNTQPDAWFNAWFQTLRTAYGWYVFGRAHHDAAAMSQAESVLNLALTAPRKDGAFSSIYLLHEKQWLPGDGWASYADSYHTFSMSWTAYWMLRWGEDLVPQRRAEILSFLRPYGDLLLQHQAPGGVIPSWFVASSLEPRTEFKDFNAETGASALFLVALAKSTDDPRYLHGAERGLEFVQREVLPRQRWFDFETFLSCARKDFDFYDRWTAQYPGNNLAEMQTVQAMLALYNATHQQRYLDLGTQMLDYLLLTQQVWNNPQFTPMLLGGFTTQNTDAEWSDARQAYMATLLADFYRATGSFEYLERSVAAARSTFAVAPWENWAHTGYIDEPGALTGFHWGTGSAMTSVEILSPLFGDAFIDLASRRGVGVDECTLTDVAVEGNNISFRITSPARPRTFLLRVAGVDAGQTYTVQWNGNPPQRIAGSQLLADGLRIGPLPSSGR